MDRIFDQLSVALNMPPLDWRDQALAITVKLLAHATGLAIGLGVAVGMIVGISVGR